MTDPEEDIPAVDRVPTRPLPRVDIKEHGDRLEVEFSEETAEVASAFLEAAARSIRKHKRLVLLIVE